MLNLPSDLATPVEISGHVASKVMLDLTVYLLGPSEQEFEFLIDLYDNICPTGHRTKYKITELQYWPKIEQPDLTASGRAAAVAGIRRPYLEPVRKRIRDGRAFEAQYWDGLPIDDPEGSWSFNCRCVHLRSTGLHSFVRILAPLATDLEILRSAATSIVENIELYSGHGGLVFAYDPWLKVAALDAIYAQARRFWGADVEDLNVTLPLMKEGIKGVNWITLLGRRLTSENSAAQIEAALAKIATVPEVTIEQCRHGSVLTLGSAPVVGDQHRPDRSLDPYYAVAKELKPLVLTAHPDFGGERFIRNGNTVGWIRRFIDPSGWR